MSVMKLFVIVAVLALCAVPAQAQLQSRIESYVPRTAGGVSFGYRLGFIELDDEAVDIDFSHSLFYSQMVSSELGYELEASYLVGDDSGYSLFTDALWKWEAMYDIVPYARLGAGFQHEGGPGRMFTNLEDAVSARVGIGGEFFSNENVSADVEILQVFTSSDIGDSLQIRAGIKSSF